MSTEKQRSSQTIKKCLKLIQDFVGKKEDTTKMISPFSTYFIKKRKSLYSSLHLERITGLGRGARRALVVGGKNSHLGCFFTRLSSSPSIKVRFPKEKARTKVLAFSFGADYGARTRHLDLGKVALYQMS